MAYQTIKKETCPHISEMKITNHDTQKTECEVCEEKTHLRFCTSCGGVFCCESHKAHNREHFDKTGHPIIKAVTGLPYSWSWCWKCNAYLE